MNEGKPGFMIYWELMQMLTTLPQNQYKKVMEGIWHYAEEGISPVFPPRSLAAGYWPVLKKRLDQDQQRYDDLTMKCRIKGLKSTFKKNYAPAHHIDPKNTLAMEEYVERRLREIEKEKKSTAVETCQPTPTSTSTPTPTSTPTSTPPGSEEGACAHRAQRKVFVPPSLSEVEAYCRESGCQMDCRRFLDYYTSNGWMVGKNSMKNWKAAVRNWNAREDHNGNEETGLYGSVGHTL